MCKQVHSVCVAKEMSCFNSTEPSELDKYFNAFSRMVLKEKSPSPLGLEPMAFWFKYKMHYSSLFREPYAIFREQPQLSR